MCSSPPGPRPVAASKTAAVLADSRRWIAADCTGADDALSASLVSEEEALLCVCLLMICLPLELTPGKSYVCKFQKVQRSEKRNAEMKGRIRARQGGGAVGRINSCVFFLHSNDEIWCKQICCMIAAPNVFFSLPSTCFLPVLVCCDCWVHIPPCPAPAPHSGGKQLNPTRSWERNLSHRQCLSVSSSG